MVFALSRTGMLRSYIESYEVADLLREVRRKYLSSCDFCTLSKSRLLDEQSGRQIQTVVERWTLVEVRLSSLF